VVDITKLKVGMKLRSLEEVYPRRVNDIVIITHIFVESKGIGYLVQNGYDDAGTSYNLKTFDYITQPLQRNLPNWW